MPRAVRPSCIRSTWADFQRDEQARVDAWKRHEATRERQREERLARAREDTRKLNEQDGDVCRPLC